MRRPALALFALITLTTMSAVHADSPEYRLTIKNHRFEPATLTVPAGQKFRLVVENLDPTPEEFESETLNREKIIPGNSKAIIQLGPLKPGTHAFIGEFNPKTASGTLIVK